MRLKSIGIALSLFTLAGSAIYADSPMEVRKEVRYQQQRAQQEFQRYNYDNRYWQGKQDADREVRSSKDESLIQSTPIMDNTLREPNLMESR
jgi:hypothetical protein